MDLNKYHACNGYIIDIIRKINPSEEPSQRGHKESASSVSEEIIYALTSPQDDQAVFCWLILYRPLSSTTTILANTDHQMASKYLGDKATHEDESILTEY
jgi:hypothetical protein